MLISDQLTLSVGRYYWTSLKRTSVHKLLCWHLPQCLVTGHQDRCLECGNLPCDDVISTDSVHRARPLSCPGSELQGVKLLQNYKDATDIHSCSLGHRAVVIGASFIGHYFCMSFVCVYICVFSQVYTMFRTTKQSIYCLFMTIKT